MKRYEETNEFDNEFISMNHKLKLTDEENRQVLLKLNSEMGQKTSTRKLASFHKKYYFVFAAACILFAILSLSQFSNMTQERTGDSTESLGGYSFDDPKQSVEKYYTALINENYEEAFNYLLIYDEHYDGGTTLTRAEAKEKFMEKINYLKQINYQVTDFEIKKVSSDDGGPPLVRSIVTITIDGEVKKINELIQVTDEGLFVDLSEEDKYAQYRDGTMKNPSVHVDEEKEKDEPAGEAIEKQTAPEFELTDKETVAYNHLKEELSEVYIKDLSPVSIAKIYVQASLDQKLEVVYELYTDREDVVKIPKEEILNSKDHPTKEQLMEIFGGIQNGTFIEPEEKDGFIGLIEYESLTREKSHFSMTKDQDGIWNVSFMPIQ
ncbi:hypothetical protein VBD025_16335 [Virgibacillus flavescens]|uniref:hypothetical protein n=1 Tax=Virgibacillus flavescens TaxID=1611422 RepID=UPI003D3512F7